MASNTLTQTLRDTIRAAVLKHRFRDEAMKIVVERAALALAIYEDVLTKTQRDQIAKLPDGWLPTTDSIDVRMATDYASFQFSGAGCGMLATACGSIPAVFLRIPASMRNRAARVYDARHPLAERYRAGNDALRDFNAHFKEAERDVDAALRSFRNTKQLLVAWPELAPFVPATEAKLHVPALPTAKLNEMLGLPVAAD